jgi:hypothetical protein
VVRRSQDELVPLRYVGETFVPIADAGAPRDGCKDVGSATQGGDASP